MPDIHFSEILPHSAAELYALVMDIERYPEIFDDVTAVDVRDIGPDAKDVDVSVSTPFKQFQYNCTVTGTPPHDIDIVASAGIFKSMNAHWRFEPQPDGRTKVSYNMSFDFGGFGLVNMAAEGFFKKQVYVTRDRLTEYAAQKLQHVSSVSPPHPAPP